MQIKPGIIVLLLFSLVNQLYFSKITAAHAQRLTSAEINRHFAAVILNRNQPRNGPNTSFRFQQFLRRAIYPLATQIPSQNTITSLRNLYMNVAPNVLPTHIMSILIRDLNSTQFVDNKLLETEIRFLNQFTLPGNTTAINGANPALYQVAINNMAFLTKYRIL